MPALSNPRHEAFAVAIFAGMAKGGAPSQGQAYKQAGYNVTNGNSARACASRLLTFANGVAQRIQELQSQAAAQEQESVAKITRELNEIQQEARAEKAFGAAATAALGKARILGLEAPKRTEIGKPGDFTSATSQSDIGKQLLEQVGMTNADDTAIALACEANARFIDQLCAIRDRALSPSH